MNEWTLWELFQNSEEMLQFCQMILFDMTTHIMHLEYFSLDTLGNCKSKNQTEIGPKSSNIPKFTFWLPSKYTWNAQVGNLNGNIFWRNDSHWKKIKRLSTRSLMITYQFQVKNNAVSNLIVIHNPYNCKYDTHNSQTDQL